MTETESNVAEFRNKFFKTLDEDHIDSSIDSKDLKRIKVSDDYVRCFIHWRRGDIDAAVKMAVLVLKWRKDNNISGLRCEEINTDILKRGVIYVHGRALDNTRLVYFVARHQTKDIKADVQKILCLWLERLHHQEIGKHVTFILDVSKTSMSNVDMGGIRFLMDCFITYFPDMLERIIILEMPWIMNAIWKVVKQWMTEEQRKRTAFLSFKDLTQFVAPDNILTYMGGSDEWIYEYPPPSDQVPCLSEIPNFDQDEISLKEDEEEEEYAMDDVEITLTETKEISSTDGTDSEVVLVNRGKPSDKSVESLNHLLTVPVASKSRPLSDSVERRDTLSGSSKAKENSKLPGPGINLHSLLILNPVSEITFDQEVKDVKLGKYQSVVTLTNPNDSGEVAFKIKTNAPDRYHVKPSNGSVAAGESLKIRLNLTPGFEEIINKDRFLILYAEKPVDADVVEFWQAHLSKEKHFEHRMRVKFNSSTPTVEAKDSFLSIANVHSPEVKTSTPTDVEMEKIKKDLSTVKNKLNVVENSITYLRTKLHCSLILNCVLLLCLFYAIHQLSLITMLLQYEKNPKKL